MKFLLCILFFVIGMILSEKIKIFGNEDQALYQAFNQIASGMADNVTNLKQASYDESKKNAELAINGLKGFAELLMPLEERLQRTIDRQKTIIEQTGFLANQNTTPKIEETAQLQNDNIQQTQLILKFIEEVPEDNQRKQILQSLLEELNPALSGQIKAENNIREELWEFALSEEKKVKEYLQKALEKLQESQKNQNQNKEQEDSSQNQKEKPSADQKSQNTPQDTSENTENLENKEQKTENESQDQTKEGNKSEDKEPQKQTEETTSDRLTPEEALRQMEELQKQSLSDRQQREKRSGAQPTQKNRVPVAKDW